MALEYEVLSILSQLVTMATGYLANQQRRSEASDAYNRSLAGFGQRYTLQMEDMRRAGLNPILSYRQAPPGMPSAPMPMVENVGLTSAQSDAASSAGALSRQQRELAELTGGQVRAQTENINADTRIKRAEEILRGTMITQQSLRNAVLAEEISGARARASSARHTERLYESEVGPMLRVADELMRILRGRGGPRSD